MKITPQKKTTPRKTTRGPRSEYVSAFIKEVAGEEGLRIAECIGGCAVTDDAIEQNTKMKIAEIRSVLNHLHSYGLVEYTREKNLQTGWFTYTWRLNIGRALKNFIAIKRKEYEALKEKIGAADGSQIYKCTKGCARLPFEEAMDFQFKCPACSSKLLFVDYQEELSKLESKIKTLTTTIEKFQREASYDKTSLTQNKTALEVSRSLSEKQPPWSAGRR